MCSRRDRGPRELVLTEMSEDEARVLGSLCACRSWATTVSYHPARGQLWPHAGAFIIISSHLAFWFLLFIYYDFEILVLTYYSYHYSYYFEAVCVQISNDICAWDGIAQSAPWSIAQMPGDQLQKVNCATECEDMRARWPEVMSSSLLAMIGRCCTWDNVFDKTRVCGKSFRMRCCTPRRGLGIHRGRRWGLGIHRGRRRGLGIHRGRL